MLGLSRLLHVNSLGMDQKKSPQLSQQKLSHRLECWLLERDGFSLNFRFSSLLSDFRLSGFSTAHVPAERLIHFQTGFLDG